MRPEAAMAISSIRHSRRKKATTGIARYPKAELMNTPSEQKTTLVLGLRTSAPVGECHIFLCVYGELLTFNNVTF